MSRNKGGTRKKTKGIQAVTNCVDCGNKLPKGNKHHWRCHKCWEKHQLKKGNLGLITGI